LQCTINQPNNQFEFKIFDSKESALEQMKTQVDFQNR